jgi:hypothetical protein
MPPSGRLVRNGLSIVGAALVTISAVLFLVVFLADLFGLHTNPYIGLIFFLVLPGIFILGLALVPIGAWFARRRRRGAPPSSPNWPRVDLNDPFTGGQPSSSSCFRWRTWSSSRSPRIGASNTWIPCRFAARCAMCP